MKSKEGTFVISPAMLKTLLLIAACLFGLTAAAPAAEDAPVSYQNGNVVDLLTTYAKLTGKKILPDTTVQGQVGIIASKDESTERKIELIEKALFLNGFTLVDAGEDVVEVMGLGRPVRLLALPLYTKPEDLPSGERVFTYLFRLEHRDARELAAVLSQYTPPSVSTSFTPDKGARTLLVTGQTSVVRELIKLVAALDVPADQDKSAEPKPGSPPGVKF